MLAEPRVLPADRAASPRRAAPDAHFFFDAAFDLRDQLRVFLRAQHIGPALAPAVFVARRRARLLLDHLCAVNARRLSARRPAVVEDARPADEQLRELLQRRTVEALKVAIHLVVAQLHRKGVDLLRAQLLLRKAVDARQLLRRHGDARFLSFLAQVCSSLSSFSSRSLRACSRYSSALASSTRSCKLMSSHSTAKRQP